LTSQKRPENHIKSIVNLYPWHHSQGQLKTRQAVVVVDDWNAAKPPALTSSFVGNAYRIV
jgi:hypothetical protein